MRRFVLCAFVLAVVSIAFQAPAQAAQAYDSQYFGESAFLSLSSGQTGQFAVAFNNIGSTGWQTGTASQVNLAICTPDKSQCNTTSPYASWASGWLSSTAYATQSTAFVGPGQTGWFVYSVRPPTGTPNGITVRFNGDLVLAATGQLIHPEGYYQDAMVGGAAAAPTQIAVTQSYQTAQIGSFPLVTVTVTADPPAGSSTRVPVASVLVQFDISTTAAFNPLLTYTASTNALGQASITYTRANPGTDVIAAYVAATPTIRTSASLIWNLTGSRIAVTPNDNVTRANDVAGCRTYSFTAYDSTGALVNAATLYVNFIENINHTTDQDGGATIAGDTTGSPSPSTAIAATTNNVGVGGFTVCGNGSTVAVTPIVFDNAGAGNPMLLETGDNAATGGTITFTTRLPVLTVTPTGTAAQVVGGQLVYSISAVDQFGTAYTGPVRVSFQELQDGNPSTTTGALITWYDNDTTLALSGASGPNAPVGTTDIADTQNLLLPNLNSAGQATIGVYAVNPQIGTPLVWVDTNSNGSLDTGEASATGATTTWSAATLSQCTLTKSKPLLPVSIGSPNTAVLGNGAVFFVATFRDQSGTPVALPPQVVTFQVTNTGGSTIASRAEGQTADTLIGSGGSASQPTANAIGETSAYVVLDSAGATSASVAVSFTAGGTQISCGPTTVRWVLANPEPTTDGSLTGTVTDFDKGSGTNDGGGYVLHTAGGDFVITYSPGQPLIVTAASVTEAQFETALSVGDVILWSLSGGSESHNIITNN